MKKIKKKLEKKLISAVMLSFVLAVGLGFGTGYYSIYQKVRQKHQLYKKQEFYKQRRMAQLNYRIKYLPSTFSNGY